MASPSSERASGLFSSTHHPPTWPFVVGRRTWRDGAGGHRGSEGGRDAPRRGWGCIGPTHPVSHDTLPSPLSVDRSLT
eukprot:5763254-Pleurochrysis_carterae.AAC.1